jgi:hypothetical protein
MRTAEETAVLIALLFKRSKQKRARISVATFRRLSQRRRIRHAFSNIVGLHLDDLGLILVELDRGGYGLILSSALNGAPAITAKRYLSEDLKKLKQGMSFNRIRAELEEDIGTDQGDEDD